MPSSFYELNDADPMAAAQHPQRQTECGRGLPFASAGVDDEEPLLDRRLAGDLAILHRLALRHLGAMALGLGGIDRLGHGISFKMTGMPATTRTTRSACAAIRWLRSPCRSRKRRASAFSGTMPKPTSLATNTTGAAARASACSKRPISAS